MPEFHKTLTFIAAMAIGTAAIAQDADQAGDSDAEGLSMGNNVDDPTYVKEEYEAWELKCFRSEAQDDPCQLYQLLSEGSEGNRAWPSSASSGCPRVNAGRGRRHGHRAARHPADRSRLTLADRRWARPSAIPYSFCCPGRLLRADRFHRGRCRRPSSGRPRRSLTHRAGAAPTDRATRHCRSRASPQPMTHVRTSRT